MDFRRWITIDTADANSVNWRDPYMITKNAATAQKSVDGTKMLISYNEVMPNSLGSIASLGDAMDRTAMEALMATTDWYVDYGLEV